MNFMPRVILFITHPQVVIEPHVPSTEWRLSPEGIARMERFSRSKLAGRITAICSSEDSATGYLPPDELAQVVLLFYANPNDSVFGRERAIDAQARIVKSIAAIAKQDSSSGDIAVISHGGVGCLLTAYLFQSPISIRIQQPVKEGGSYIAINCDALKPITTWRPLEDTSTL
jgi:broad specificity phosphatase PhoE